MALYPGNYNDEYNISDIKKGSSAKNRGFGQDTSQNTDNIIYISSIPLERTIAFKAFLESFKINFTREQEIGNELDKADQTVITHKGELSIDISLNVPAHSTNDAKNNIAKIAELQKLVFPLDTSSHVTNVGIKTYNAVSNRTNTIVPIFAVLFKNLISNGKASKCFSPSECSFTDIYSNGFVCMISDVSYEPDMEQGFFDFQNYLYPKNIKLNLKLEYLLDDNSITINEHALISGFDLDGKYNEIDGCFFPFGIKVKTDGAKSEGGYSDKIRTVDYTTDKINEIDFGKSNDSYLFISIPTSNNSVQRWVVFRSFFESFSRTTGANLNVIDTKTSIIGKRLQTSQPSTPKPIIYKMKVNVPSENLEEAKKNCAKIQYLARMFYKPNPAVTQLEFLNMLKQIALVPELSETQRKLKFYSPSFIEKPNASNPAVPPTDFRGMYGNSILMSMNNLSVDYSMEEGFFQDKTGFLFPKALSIDIEMIYTDGDLQKNYRLDDTNPNENKYSMVSAVSGSDSYGFEHLFPYNRKTSTLKIGG